MKKTENCLNIIKNKQEMLIANIDFQKCEEHIINQLKTDNKNSIKVSIGESFANAQMYEYLINEEKNIYTRIWVQEDGITKIQLNQYWEVNSKIDEKIILLGKSYSKLDYYYDVILMKEKIWVYPEKGVAIFWGINNNSIYKMEYFAPTTLEEYKLNLYNPEKQREF